MSAESPRKSSRQGSPVVAPQPVSDRSIIESVAGFINEVVPQAYTATPQGEGKEAITWARFEYGDINDPALYPDTADDRNDSPPLLLVLGYGSGVQVWAIPANGEATEVLSWRQGIVRTLRILPTPGVESGVTDSFAHKRPLVAICDSAGGPMPQFCSLSFISLRGGDQVKSIKFKNPVSDVLANRRSVVVTFLERIAVFDAATLEDRLTVTTCYPCPGPNPNPVALGSRWLAYTERKLYPAKRSSGGTEGEGVQSYTATMLHAAKSFGKGLRELGETVASSLTGGGTGVGGQRGMGGGVCGTMSGQQGGNIMSSNADALQPGVVTIIDAQGTPSSDHIEETRGGDSIMNGNVDNVIAHFLAHSEPIVALQFDPSGMLLLTADKRGHDFHVFRIHPHPGGPSLAAVHHLYVLHRGDTTAKVQDIAFAADSRWVAVSTLRGTTHVFPITPYGGSVGIRTHTTPHVVNRLSRFHRSAGLTADGRNSPLPTPVSETVSTPPSLPYPNPRLPPYSHPTVISPLAQIRQPMTNTLLSNPTAASLNPASQQTYHRNPSMRALGRTQSSVDEGPGGGIPLRVTSCFAPPRAWLIGSPTVPRDASSKAHRRAVDSLFVMACHGNLIEYDLEPKHAAGIPKEKICDDTPIELEVSPKAQWMLLRPPHSSDLQPPLSPTNPLMVVPDRLPNSVGCESRPDDSDSDERWLSQVEIITHAGPHRRLWMGPQFTFKTYNSSGTSVPVSLLESEAVEVGLGSGSRPARSNPVNMPLGSGTRPVVPVLIESGSGSSYEQSPRLLEAYGTDGADSDGSAGPGENQLREDLADAMMESPGVPTRDTGRRVVVELRQGGQLGKKIWNPIHKVVNPVGTVITVSYPCEELPSSLPSDLNTAITTEHQVSSEQDSRVRLPSLVNLKCVKEHPLIPDNNNKDPLEQASIKWPALAKPTETFSSRPTTGENTDTITAKKSVVLKSKESEGKVQKKGKGIAANLSAKKSDKTQDEERSAGKKGKEIKKDNSGFEVEDKGQNLSWKPHSSEMAKEKISEDKAWEKMETKHKSGSSLTKYTSDAATEVNITCTTSRETDVKSKIKCSVTSKGKDSSGGVISKKQTTNAANLTLQESSKKIKSVKLEDDTSCESASKIEDMKSLEPKASKRNSKHKSSILISTANDSLEDEVFSESPLKLDEEKSFETKGSKRNTKHKSTNLSPNVEDSYKSVLKVDCLESVKSIEEASKISDRDPTVAKKLSLLDLADKESTSEIDSRDEFDSLSLDSVKVKKTSLKAKLRQPVVPKYPFSDEDKFYADSGKKDIVEVENLVTFTTETELLPQLTTALSERFSEHHFGIESTSNKYTDDIGFDLIQDKTLKLAFEAGEKCGELSNLNLGESGKTAQHTAEKRASQGSSDIEAFSDVGSQENLLFKSSFDEVFLPPPPKTWSSIVSSSKSSTREKSSSSETLLSKLDVRISPQRSASELTSSDPSSSLVVQSEESTITDKYSVLQPSKLDDVDDCSDEDKVTIGSNKSQSSDRTSGSDMVTASESLSIVITSESSAATAGNDEDNSQLNEESNGNDDEGLDNGDNSGTSASLGANKKNRRTKKKRR